MLDDLEFKVLQILAKEFEYTQGLHVEVTKLQKLLGLKKELSAILESLENQKLVNLYKEKDKIKLAKITWRGLNEIGEVSLKYGLGKDYYKNYKMEL
ncbi:MAG: hypothetical protein WED07_14505 [Candidatus Freyarchaeum deiterrae]